MKSSFYSHRTCDCGTFTQPSSFRLSKKSAPIFHDESLPKGMNLHTCPNTFDSLIFSFPRKESSDIPNCRILMNTYDLTSCSTEQHLHHSSFEVTAADPPPPHLLGHGAAWTDYQWHSIHPDHSLALCLSRHQGQLSTLPQHYKSEDIAKLFSSYGKPMHIGMYYRDHPERKIWTQEGYIMFEAGDVYRGAGSMQVFWIVLSIKEGHACMWQSDDSK
ncbi:MAG: hypothetical protein JOS17DRAFT_275849 [Linnemannia elongata]|nr:MAG: hypothetical protein JOS17DRAFT_275849 [Linnemannia elongata]